MITKNGIYIPTFTKDLEQVFSKLKGKTLLDLGSGKGDVVYLANLCGLDAYGVEIDPQFYEKSLNKEKIIFGDMFDIEWKNYDILYYYLAGCKMEREIIKRLRDYKGKVIFYLRGVNERYIKDFFSSINGKVLLKTNFLRIYNLNK